MKSVFRLFGLLVLALCITACHSLRISIDEKVPPSFSFSASRYSECCTHLDLLYVYEEPSGNRPGEEEKILWEIRPGDDTPNDAWDLPHITYGKVPPGFYQTIPEKGDPPPLVEGKTYGAAGPTVEVPEARVGFIIRNGESWIKE